jgi:hypothetical protein
MQFAFNFDEIKYYEERDGSYPVPLDAIAAQAIASCVPPHRRHCLVQSGSVDNYPKSGTDDVELLLGSLISFPPRWRGLLAEQTFMEAIYGGALCAVIINGIASQDAAEIDEKWHSLEIPGYIGSFQLLHGEPLHEGLYFMYLPSRYSMYKNSLSFYVTPETLAGDADYDDSTYDALNETLPVLGVTDIRLRSIGLTDTFFDPYGGNFEFAQAVGRVERSLQSYTEGIITEITLRARAEDPRLLEVLDAALASLRGEPGVEVTAQAALSCRRFLERLADVLFPPTDTVKNGKQLGKAQYVNRLWAYVEESLGPEGSKTLFKEIGNRIDSLNGLANKGLHDDIPVDEMDRLVLNLVLLTHDLMRLTPPTGDPSASYSKLQVDGLTKMLRRVHGKARRG